MTEKTPPRRRQIAGIALLALFPAVALLEPWIVKSRLVMCPYRNLTGYPCALCGLTRALALAMRGQWGEATRYNLFWPLAVLLIAGTAVWLLWHPFPVVASRPSGKRIAPNLLWLGGLLLILLTLARYALAGPDLPDGSPQGP